MTSTCTTESYSSPVPVLEWKDISIAQLVEDNVPVVLRNSPVASWKAKQWSLESLWENRLDSTNTFEAQTLLYPNNSSLLWSIYSKPLEKYSTILPKWKCDMKSVVVNSKIALKELETSSEKFLIKLRMKEFRSTLYNDIPGWGQLTLGNHTDPQKHDSDIWITNNNLTSYMHYDLQHNFYANLVGEKSFQLIAPEFVDSLKLFPYLHPRHRQVHSFMASSPSFTAHLQPGYVLYIPPLWLHSGRSQALSISLGTCFSSTIETAIAVLERLPLPFEFEWPAKQRHHRLMHFLHVFAKVFGFINGNTLLKTLFEMRYQHTFSLGVLKQLQNLQSVQAGERQLCAEWSWERCTCHNQEDDETVRIDSVFEDKARRVLEKAKMHIDELKIPPASLRIVLLDTVEQWIEFLISELEPALVVAFCHNYPFPNS